MAIIETNEKYYVRPANLDIALLSEAFIGRKIVSANYEDYDRVIFTLDNGVRVQLKVNEGCGGCENGHFTLTDYTKFDHVITSASVLDNENDYVSGGATIELFVYGEGISEKIATVKGSEGNGYYGRGFKLSVLTMVRKPR